jgi:hypothetical protein
MDVFAIRTAIKQSLDGLELQVYDYVPDSPNVPCLIVYPRPFDYDSTYTASTGATVAHSNDITFVVMCLAGTVNMKGAQQTLDGWLSDTGASSVKAAIETDEELGGVVSSVDVTRVDSYGTIQLQDGGTRYLSAEILVEVLT